MNPNLYTAKHQYYKTNKKEMIDQLDKEKHNHKVKESKTKVIRL